VNRLPNSNNPGSLSSIVVGSLVIGFWSVTPLRAEVITDWNRHTLYALSQSTLAGNSLVTTRVTAIVSAAVFDAVNGIDGRFTPIRVAPAAPRGASREAAAIQAAYATLVSLFPGQADDLAIKRTTSLAAIASATAVLNSESIQRGIEWGATVAAEILAWRATDGFTPEPPAFFGDPLTIGRWRATPTAFAKMAGPQFASMKPWVLDSAGQFTAPGPPALTSARYAADFNETKGTGAAGDGSPLREEVARFWTSNTPAGWNRILATVADGHQLSLPEAARLFALVNVAMADAAIACWHAKWEFQFWRPITAIELAGLDGNQDTAPPAPGTQWTPRLTTPPHQEYPSGHSTVSAAAVAVLADFFGDATPFTTDSEMLPGVTRTFNSFSESLAEIHNARIWGGIHFRSACADGSVLGEAVAAYVMGTAMLPAHGAKLGQLSAAAGR